MPFPGVAPKPGSPEESTGFHRGGLKPFFDGAEGDDEEKEDALFEKAASVLERVGVSDPEAAEVAKEIRAFLGKHEQAGENEGAEKPGVAVVVAPKPAMHGGAYGQ